MVEVFKTNVSTEAEAFMILDIIHTNFKGYLANFDLEDEDKILRIKTESKDIDIQLILNLFAMAGFKACVLPDEIPIINNML